MESQSKNNRALRGLAVLLILLLSSVGRADWTATPGSVKVYIKKRVNIPAIGQTASTVPPGTLAKWNAAIVDDRSGYMILQVPSANTAGLKTDLLPRVDSIQVRNDFDILDFLASPVDARLPEPAYPALWDRTAPLTAPARDAFVIQFAAVPRPKWLDDLRSAGATIIDYIPQNGYVVLASTDALDYLAQHAPLQLRRLQQPFHKTSAAIRNAKDSFVDIAVSIANAPEGADARAFLQANSIHQLLPVDTAGNRNNYRVTFATSALPQLASYPAVIAIELYSPPRLSGEREAHLVAGDTMVTTVGTTLQPTLPGEYRNWLVSKGVRRDNQHMGNPDYRTSTKVGILDTGFDKGCDDPMQAQPCVPSSPHMDFLDDTGIPFVQIMNETNDSASNRDCQGHGTFVASVFTGNAGADYSTTTKDLGSDAQYYMGLGVVPSMPLFVGRVWNVLAPPQGNFTFDPKLPWSGIFTDLLNNGVGITSVSWNFNDTGYTLMAQTFDRIVRAGNGVNYGPPMAIYCSAGNWEYRDFIRGITSPATAKNVITVGGSENVNPNVPITYGDNKTDYGDPGFTPMANSGSYADNGNDLWTYSAKGPTMADSRIKPDIVAPASALEAARTADTAADTEACGTGLIGSDIDSEWSPSGEQHIWSRGTSFSSPAAAGAGALLYTWFKNRAGSAPRPSLLKAMEINAAYDLTGVDSCPNPGHDPLSCDPPVALGRPPDDKQGWGKADLTRAFMTDGRYDWANEDSNTLITQSGSSVYFPSAVGTYRIKDTTRPVRITLVWTDQFASTLTGAALVNDLNLKVWMYTGQYALGNDFNRTTGRSNIYSTGGTYNHADNVEQVVFTYADVGTTQFVVEVNGYAITGDAIDVWTAPPYVPQQDFAIFIDNVVGR